MSGAVTSATRRYGGTLGELLVRNTVLLAAAVVFVAFSLASSKFASGSNLRNIAIQGSGSAVMAVGMTFVIITAGIDLSVGAILFLSTAGAAELFVHGLPVVWAPLVAVLFGLGLGAVNGASIAFVAINPLIVTLATLNLYRGLGGHLTGFTTVYLPPGMTMFGTATVASIPAPIIVAAFVALAGGLVLRRTVFGRYVQAIGANAEAARNLGLPVRRVLVGVYAISGLTAALAGLIENGRLGALQPTVGLGEELTVITAVVLGGTSLFGGKGSILGSLLGVALLQMVADGLVLARISPYVFDMLRASVLIVAGTLLLRNATGLWMLQECRRAWARAGADIDYEDLVARTEQVPQLRSIVDTDDPAFLAPGDMPGRIRDHCTRAGEPSPVDQAAIARCVLESLALKYRQTIDLLETVTGSRPPAIHVVGGGALNRLLCQWTADATGLPVIAGPVEAAEIGNLAVQALAIGELASIDEVRVLVDRSFTTHAYEPRARAPWDEAYARLEQAAAHFRRTLEVE